MITHGKTHTIIAKDTNDVSFSNDVGGTISAPPGRYHVRLKRQWYDSEIGWRAIGWLTREKEIAKLRALGTTQYGPKKPDWNPAEVYFSAE
jgi:hypothetical protein